MLRQTHLSRFRHVSRVTDMCRPDMRGSAYVQLRRDLLLIADLPRLRDLCRLSHLPQWTDLPWVSDLLRHRDMCRRGNMPGESHFTRVPYMRGHDDLLAVSHLWRCADLQWITNLLWRLDL
jgi:hypothetical protein